MAVFEYCLLVWVETDGEGVDQEDLSVVFEFEKQQVNTSQSSTPSRL